MPKKVQGSFMEAVRVPIAVLPLDLQLAVGKAMNWGAMPVSRKDLALGIGLIFIGITQAYFQENTVAFGSTIRMGALFLGIALVIMHFRRPAAPPAAGGSQRYVIGPASIAVPENDVVRVIPAEDLHVDLRGIFYGNEVIDGQISPESPRFYQQFQQFLADVKANPSLATQDRFRLAAIEWAGRGKQYGRAQKLERWVMLPAFCAAIVFGMEAGPIHQRSLRHQSGADLAQRLQKASGERSAATTGFVKKALDRVAGNVTQARRKKLLDGLAAGVLEDGRVFLEEFAADDAETRHVLATVENTCAKQFRKPVVETNETRAKMAILTSICMSPGGSTLYYSYNQLTGVRALETYLEKSWNLEWSKASVNASPTKIRVEPAVWGQVKRRYVAVEVTALNTGKSNITLAVHDNNGKTVSDLVIRQYGINL